MFFSFFFRNFRNTLSSPPPALLSRPSSNGSNILLSNVQHSHQHNFQSKHSHQSERSSSHQSTAHQSSTVTEPKPSSHHQSSVHHSVSTVSQNVPPASSSISSTTAAASSIAATSLAQDSKQLKHPQVQSTELQIKPVNTASLLNPVAPQPIEQPPESPCIAPSLSSNSSDSEIGTSPSFDERIKNLDEMFEMWNGGITTRSSSHSLSENPTTPTSSTSFSSRHKFLELDVNDVKPSDILKSVLSKKSIFDDDFKRLENIGEKYEPKDFINLNRTATTISTNNAKPITTPVCTSQLPKLHSIPQQTTTFIPQISQALPRLNAVSPMNSPQPHSPYNSPSPSPIVVTPNMSTAKMSNNIAAVPPVKGLQYPFPTHPPIPNPSPGTTLPNATSVNKTTENTNSSQDQDSIKSKSHSSKTINIQDKNQTSNGSKCTLNTNRLLNKSASVPGSNHSGTVRSTLTSSCSLNMSIKDESNESLENVIPSRKTSREEKNSNAKNEHAKKTDLFDRRKWESISSENSNPASSSEILSERTENERVGREWHDSMKLEPNKTKNKSRNQNEIEPQERCDETRIKYEHESKKSDEYEYRRREVDSDDAVHNWKQDYKQNPQKDREHIVTVNHFTKTDKHNKENAAKSRESTPLDRQQYSDDVKNASKNSRSNSPSKIMPKRRLSSHESVDSDDGKRFKFGADNVKMERRDFKDPNGRSGMDKSSKHQRNFNKMNNVHKSDDNLCDLDERSKKETNFDERKKERDNDKHRNKSDKSSHKSRRNKDDKSNSQFRKFFFRHILLLFVFFKNSQISFLKNRKKISVLR